MASKRSGSPAPPWRAKRLSGRGGRLLSHLLQPHLQAVQLARCGLATRSPIGRHPYTAVLTFVQLANQQTAEINVPFSCPKRFETDVIPDESFSYIPPDSLPSDFAVASHPALLPWGSVLPGRHTAKEPTAVVPKQLRGSPHAQGFMRTVMVVVPKPLRTAALLGRQGVGWIFGHLRFVDSMELFMSPILTGPSRSDELDLDSQFDPPRAQSG